MADSNPDDITEIQQSDSATTVDAAPAQHPERVGRYRIEKVLGKGGFGLVYQAYDEALDRRVAVKVPYDRLVSETADADAYLTEARTVASLDHPHIVPVYDVGSTGGFPCYIVSKYVEGGNLAARLRYQRLRTTEATELVATIAEALHYAHKRGLVHRDVKPSNILIGTDGKPYIVDFGLALREEHIGTGPRYVGTQAYMSPEQARGEGHRVDGRSDIYSLGTVLYELLSGRRPFSSDTRSGVLDQITSHEPKPLRQIDDAIPRELERICLKALSKRAADRYTTALDMADDLRHYLAQLATDLEARSTPAADARPGVAAPTSSADSTTVRSESASIRIVPKGLRSFDEHDADFFLKLLPGPRDREGIPDSLRFWKTRVEETDADNTFPVGLIYGPSGCGKSSLVKAGLLPRLSSNVVAVYVEATPEETETRLLHGLQKRFAVLDDSLDLKGTLTALRQGHGLPVGRKVLIVLDQFEQWLHTAGRDQDTELVQALRQCDGSRVQGIVMVRDDFWMAATRFMRELEVRLVEDQNSAAVDLFPVRHAEMVLAAFGRAFGTLPDDTTRRTDDQKAFIRQSVAGLAEDGKVICVRLALFAEMMKGKPWTPTTLKNVGGTAGVGATFLEETFSASTAPPEHRLHQKAARAVLKALLPDAGTDIKGEMKSHDELLQASGYAQSPADFAELLRILDSEVRLITPTDPEGVELDQDSVARMETGQKYYQLTHDYLVHSLRDWLTRKQQETRRGRAELRLAERSALWSAKPENRYLPSWWEYGSIRLLTDSRIWSDPERAMMLRAGRFHRLRWGTALLVLFVVAITIHAVVDSYRQSTLRGRIRTAVAAMSTARGIHVPRAIEDLDEFPPEIALAELRAQFETSDETRRLPLAYALAHFDDVRVEFLLSQVENASSDEVENFVSALGNSPGRAVPALVDAAQTSEADQNWPRQARLAMLALHLGSPDLAQAMCELRPNPIRRTWFIEECSTWHGDLSRLAQRVSDSADAPLRSAVALVAGSASQSDVTVRDRRAWEPVLSDWYRNEPDTLTHSAAGWTLRTWNLELPDIATSTVPVENREWLVNSVGMTMLSIPAGSFIRKDSHGSEEAIEQEVTLSRGFLLADTPVTREQFRQFIDDPDYRAEEKPEDWIGAHLEFSPTPRHPVQQANWYDAVLFCNWLSRREGLRACYERTGEKETIGNRRFDEWRLVPGSNGYRLPTEAMWEHACRAGTITEFAHGNDESLLAAYAVCRASHAEPVGSRLPNGWGLFDLHGNVWEWCQDWFGPFGEEPAVSDPVGPRAETGVRVLRGGSFRYLARYARSGNRNFSTPDNRSYNVGFRVTRSNLSISR